MFLPSRAVSIFLYLLSVTFGIEQTFSVTNTDNSVSVSIVQNNITAQYNIARSLLREVSVISKNVSVNLNPLLLWQNTNASEFFVIPGVSPVYEYKPSYYKPSVKYFFGENITAPFENTFFACEDGDLIEISRLAFTCREVNSTGINPSNFANTSFSLIVDLVRDSNENSLPSASWAGTYTTFVNITDSPSRSPSQVDAVNKGVTTLVAFRLRRIAELQTRSYEILENNEKRLSSAQTAMLFIYLLVSVVAFISSCLLGLLLSWMWAPCTCIKRPPPCSIPSWSSIIWICLLNFLLFLLVGVTGLLGGMIVLFLYWAVLLFMYVYSECMFRRQLKLAIAAGAASDGKVTNIELQQADGHMGHIHVKGLSEEQLPQYMQPRLTRNLICVFFFVIILTGIIIAIIFFAFTVQDLQLWSRVDGQTIVEYIPQLTAKGIVITYAWPQFATNLQLALFMRGITVECATKFSKPLTPEEKDKEIYEEFIKQYAMDMSIYDPSDYREYFTVNDWFIRRLRTGARPVAAGDKVMVSPADARTLAFDAVGNSKVWIKGGVFTVAELMDDIPGGQGHGLSTNYTSGHMLISRLAPQDYHRFHMPLDGKLVHKILVSGTFWSVGKDAATSGNYAFYNERTVMVFENKDVGRFAYIAIGATCVGSVNIEVRDANRTIFPYKVGDELKKGDELGNMQFGGSTVITLFPTGTVLWDDDLRYAASLPVESYLQMGQRIGILTSARVPYLPIPSAERTVNVGLGAAPIAGMCIGALLGVVLAALLFYLVVKKCQGKDITVPPP